MKKLVSITDVEGEGLVAFLGEQITIFAVNYIYAGKLEGVNATCVKLTEAAIVYETGAFTDPKWRVAERLPSPVYVQITAIESFTHLEKS